MKAWFAALILVVQPSTGTARPLLTTNSVDAAIHDVMTRSGARGIAVALIRNGRVRYVRAYGVRNATGDPLMTDTVMYGASLTKPVFAFTVLQLVDQRRLSIGSMAIALANRER